MLERLDPNGVVAVVMRPHCRSGYQGGADVQIHGCIDCSNWVIGQDGAVYICLERLAVGPGGW